MHIWWEWLAVILKLGWNLFDIWYSQSTKESDDVVFGWEESVALFLGWPYVFCSEEKYDARQTKCSKETPGQGRKTLIKQFRVLFFVFFWQSRATRRRCLHVTHAARHRFSSNFSILATDYGVSFCKLCHGLCFSDDECCHSRKNKSRLSSDSATDSVQGSTAGREPDNWQSFR